jgi:hypothetical protein
MLQDMRDMVNGHPHKSHPAHEHENAIAENEDDVGPSQSRGRSQGRKGTIARIGEALGIDGDEDTDNDPSWREFKPGMSSSTDSNLNLHENGNFLTNNEQWLNRRIQLPDCLYALLGSPTLHSSRVWECQVRVEGYRSKTRRFQPQLDCFYWCRACCCTRRR